MSPDDLAAALACHEPLEMPSFPGRENPRRAGVLVPIFWDPDPICVVTERAAGLRQHGGEISFPGGKPEPGEDLRQTALRETAEELGLIPERILGRLSSVPVFTSDFRLEPWVAEIAGPPVHINPAEVARVVTLDIGAIFAQPQIDALAFHLHGRDQLSPIFDTGGRPMFGATAHAFLELLGLFAPLLGRPVPPLVPGRWTWESLRPAQSS